ncbi:MAG TPA: peptidoglycan DD-metalloendopeptidase family protein [Spirochaetota bacterium]|nr:peptidoglycan DD-metalloendopeptidase family protein [Spirochaetota bacterium]
MKKISLFLITFIIIPFAIIYSENKYFKKHEESVKKQRSRDISNKDSIIKAMGAFLEETNSILKEDNVKISFPVDENNITEIKETDEFYSTGAIPPKIYGFVTTDSLNIRSMDDSSSEKIGKLKFKEKVEILYQSDKFDTINGIKAPWLLIRKENGEEGWVFGGFISDDLPEEINKNNGKTDWNLIIPARGKISSKFGKRIDPVSKKGYNYHKGIDISAPIGTPVYAAAEGIVIKSEYVKNGYGNLIIIKHRDNLFTYYGHLSKIIAKSGDRVSQSEVIGKVGNTGRSTGPHLHFEVRRGDTVVNPEDFIK